MKKLTLMIALLMSVAATSAFAEEVKTIDIKAMLKMAQAMKSQEALISNPKTMLAFKQLIDNLDKSPALKSLMKNPESLAAMLRLAGSFKAAQGVMVE